MPSAYVPGKPNRYFPTHPFAGIPVYRNIKPVSECTLHHIVGPAATVERAIAVPILTPEHLWRTFQVEAEELIRVDGSMEAKSQERNRRISAAYARLWLADNRFQWAGLAAFASKQVGCGLLHATATEARNRSVREAVGLSFVAGMPGAEAAVGLQAGAEAGAAYMHAKLGFGNAHLFLDIYPLHRFFMERGWKEFKDYLPHRQTRKYPVYWKVDDEILPFGKPLHEIREGFRYIDENCLVESVKWLAKHEQVNVLQPILYDDPVMRRLLALNQYALVTGIPTGEAEAIELTLSAQCKAKPGFTLPFSSNRYAKLWVVEQRMQFVLRAAEQFDRLLNSSARPHVEASIRAIADGRGVE
ncbi:DUF2515 family protein [Massilia sp. Mn16-1_5]|uniref:DUF2515 family protein n=1 Tax=Massilia sp. Mn16-1_5 TaxID=2079199 RepID=UPI001B34FAC9|nr:hypothetical protein [Massilia sp. Mn16-1_5]